MGGFSLHLTPWRALVRCWRAVTIGRAGVRCGRCPRVAPALRGPLRTQTPPHSLHTRPHNAHPHVARPTQHANPTPYPAHQAPQHPPPRCQARTARKPHPIPCTPGPTTPTPLAKPAQHANPTPTLPGPLSTQTPPLTLHTKPHNAHPCLALRCEARTARKPHPIPCTPGPTTPTPTLRGPHSTLWAAHTLHTRPRNGPERMNQQTSPRQRGTFHDGPSHH